MRKRSNGLFAQAAVGFFMVMVSILLGYFTIVISGSDILSGRNRKTLQIAFSHVGGLKDHDNVMYRGTKVGTVEKVEVTPSNLVVRAEISAGVVLRSGYRAAVCNLSMLGGNYLLLEEGEGEIVDTQSVVLSGETPSDWMQDVSAIAKNLKSITEMSEIKSAITNLEAAAAEAKSFAFAANRLAQRIDRGEGTVGKLFSSDSTIYDELKKTMSGAALIVERINAGEGTVGKLLSKDDTIHEDIRLSLAAFRKSCESFDMGEAKTGITNLVVNANRLMENLNIFASRLSSSEGTLGKLASDPELYNEANNLVKDIRQVVDNYRDTTPITTFTSLLMGGL